MNEQVKRFMKSGSETDALGVLKAIENEGATNAGAILTRKLSKMFPHSFRIRLAAAQLAFKVGSHRYNMSNGSTGQTELNYASDTCMALTEFGGLSETSRNEVWSLYRQCVPFLENRFVQYDPKKIKEITERPPSSMPLVTFTITTCKRYDLFQDTMDSFLNCCLDLDRIDRWICVDDNSSLEDREKMRKRYPFFTFIFKSRTQKGHPQSMNLLQNAVHTPYYFHIEDDWKFVAKRPYIGDCLAVLGADPKLGQCLINRNYTEIATDDIAGGFRHITQSGLHYFVHEFARTVEEKASFFAKYGARPQCAYWPHFSFRPSLVRSSVVRELGSYDVNVSHFEMEYANRYYSAGWRSAFLEDMFCIHTGRLTSEINSGRLNAYDLNDEAQFTGKEEKVAAKTAPRSPSSSPETSTASDATPETKEAPVEQAKPSFAAFVINLDRRPDRLEEFKKNNIGFSVTRFPAVDGARLKPTEQLQHIFEGNDYNMRKGMVGCAMSHIQLAILLTKTDLDFLLILEDDITVVPDFAPKLARLIGRLPSDWNLVYLGHHVRPQYRSDKLFDKVRQPVAERWSRKQSLERSMGGTGGYLLSKAGAYRLLSFINRTGMTNGIDTVQQKAADEMSIYYSEPHLIYSTCWDDDHNADTDIQRDYDSLTIPLNERIRAETRWYREDGSPPLLVKRLGDAQALLTNRNNARPWIYRGSSEQVGKLRENCTLPCYTLDNRALVVVPAPTQRQRSERYFSRLKKDGKYDVSDALIYVKR